MEKNNFWFDNPLGGQYDFNRDGKEDLGELFLGFEMFRDSPKLSDVLFGKDSNSQDWKF